MEKAMDVELTGSHGIKQHLSSLWKKGPLMLVFYPGDFTPVCTAQLCDYRDHYDEFRGMGLQIVGISPDLPEKHAEFSKEYAFPFPLLSDPERKAAKALGATSKWTLGLKNRAIVLVNEKGEIVFRHVEPFAITRRRAGELKEIVGKLVLEGKL